MAASDWYARKLGRAPAQPSIYQPQPQAPVYPQPVQPVYQQPQVPPQYVAPSGPQPIPQGPAARGFRDPNGQTHMGDAIQEWEGGDGTKTERDQCPRCGSGNYFSRRKSSKTGHPPAPHCFNCGSNGDLFEQFSDQFMAYDGRGSAQIVIS